MAVQTLDPPKQAADRSHSQTDAPPLAAGDYLTRPEFERRYLAHPEIKKAELIEGIVYIPSPIRADSHGDPHFLIIGWLGVYTAVTPGLRGSDNATLRLDYFNAPQPDVILRLDPEYGGRSRIGPDGYLEGPPELIVEIAASSSNYDMNQKKDVYARHGVAEYLVLLTLEQDVAWFVLRDDGYHRQGPGADGILYSEVFPGLHLQPAAIWSNDLPALLAVLQQGLATPEHAAFVEQLRS